MTNKCNTLLRIKYDVSLYEIKQNRLNLNTLTTRLPMKIR